MDWIKILKNVSTINILNSRTFAAPFQLKCISIIQCVFLAVLSRLFLVAVAVAMILDVKQQTGNFSLCAFSILRIRFQFSLNRLLGYELGKFKLPYQ